MKSIDQILKLSKNKHYHLKRSERLALDLIAQEQFESDWAELTTEQKETLIEIHGCACGKRG